MDPITKGLIGIVVLIFFLFFFEMPVGFAMALVGFLGFAWVVNIHAAISSVSMTIWNTFSSYSLAVIPFFILMGNICFESGVSKKLYKTAYTWIGHIRGGIAIATILACAGFAAICGSNAATAATMSAVALPEMKKLKYHPALSTGCVASGATLGVVIPPSIVLIVIGLSTRISITKLFFAALIPGIILTICLSSVAYFICLFKPHWGRQGKKTSFKEKLKSLPGSFEMILLFTLVMLGLYLGWFTPTEAGAAGAFFALLIAILGGNIDFYKFKIAVFNTIKTSCMILMIVAGAIIFGKFLTITRLPFVAADWICSLSISNFWIMLAIILIYIIGGAIMDALGLLMITIPIFFPIAHKLGFNLLWFSVLVTIITTMGAITPPVGINTFIVAAMAKDVDITTVFKGVSFFILAFFICISILFIFPSSTTYLPELIR